MRLYALKRKIDKTFSNKLTDAFERVNDREFRCRLSEPARVGTIVLKEDVDFSQRVSRYALLFYKKERLVFSQQGTVVGFSSFVRLKRRVECDKVVFIADSCRGDKAYLKSFELYG